MVIASFGLERADPSINWPTPDEKLAERHAWEALSLPLSSVKLGPTTVKAMSRGELAVHHMLDDKGWAISAKSNGLRISSGGRVFARSSDAMAMAEQLLSLWDKWTAWVEGGTRLPLEIRSSLNRLHDEAERRGEILLDRVYPT